MRSLRLATCVALVLLAAGSPAIAAPEGQMVMYAMHDAMVKAMPGNPTAPSLAESWQMSPDGRAYDFTLREGVKFHNGDTLTAEDVKFSFERYRGAAAKMLKDRVAAVETPDALHVRFRLKNPWPDFLTFYTAASGAGWIVTQEVPRACSAACSTSVSSPSRTLAWPGRSFRRVKTPIAFRNTVQLASIPADSRREPTPSAE